MKYRRKSDGKVVWACVKTSPGCANCYSEAITLRYVRGKLFNAQNMEELEPFLDDAELRKMLMAKTIQGMAVSGSRCFLGDMTDVFGEWVSDELLDRLFAVLALRDDVTWQVLTKRAKRMQRYFADKDRFAFIEGEAQKLHHALTGEDPSLWLAVQELPNVHLGVSVENQKYANARICYLLQTPAAVRFLSVEPLLDAVDLKRLKIAQPCLPYFWTCLDAVTGWQSDRFGGGPGEQCRAIDWCIVGGESGANARPMEEQWVIDIRDQCVSAGVPFFFKQWGGVNKKAAGRLLQGKEWNEMPKGLVLA